MSDALLLQDIAARHGLCISEDRAIDVVAELQRRAAFDVRAAGRDRGAHPTTHAAALVAPAWGNVAPGLSYSHSSPRGPESLADAVPVERVMSEAKRAAAVLSGNENGACVVIKSRTRSKSKAPPRCDNHVREFTAKSRLRLLKLVNSFDRSIVERSRCAFITLTYPLLFPTLKAVWKRQLDNFRKRLMRAYGRLGIVWKLEPQKRGAPHFHLLAFFPNGFDVVELRRFVAVAWVEVVDHVERQKHFAAGTSVEVVQHMGGVCAYAAKYVGKDNGGSVFASLHGEEILPGRFWGVWHRELLLQEKKAEATDEAGYVQARRVLRKYAEKRGAVLQNKRGWLGVAVPSFTAFLPQREVERVLTAYLPWRRWGVGYAGWREFEIEARRALYLRWCEEQLIPGEFEPSPWHVENRLLN